MATTASLLSPTGYTFNIQTEYMVCFNPFWMKQITENVPQDSESCSISAASHRP